MRVQFLGTGTPLGQGGRLQACLLLTTDAGRRVLLDCGMTSLVALARAGVATESIDAIVISHLHGDHFGGVPLVLLERALRRADHPLRIAGPPETSARVHQSLEVFNWRVAWDGVAFETLLDRQPLLVAGVEVTAYAVPHNPATAPTALRVSSGGRTIGYSGDAGWSPSLVDVAANTDVFICGVWSFDTPDPTFLDYQTLRQHRAELACQRLILTHLGPTALEHLQDLAEDHVEVAEDGWALDL